MHLLAPAVFRVFHLWFCDASILLDMCNVLNRNHIHYLHDLGTCGEIKPPQMQTQGMHLYKVLLNIFARYNGNPGRFKKNFFFIFARKQTSSQLIFTVPERFHATFLLELFFGTVKNQNRAPLSV